MKLFAWLTRLFGQGRPTVEMVPYLDVENRRVVKIPASQLAPGAVQAHVEGMEGLVWVDAAVLKPGEIRHPPFDEGIREYIRQIHETFAEHRPISIEEWEDGFRRDTTPEREIALWLHAAHVYRQFAEDEPEPERREDVYRCIGACLVASPDDVWRILQPEVLTRAEAQAIVQRFYQGGE